MTCTCGFQKARDGLVDRLERADGCPVHRVHEKGPLRAEIAGKIHAANGTPSPELIREIESYHRQRRAEDPENVVAWDSD